MAIPSLSSRFLLLCLLGAAMLAGAGCSTTNNEPDSDMANAPDSVAAEVGGIINPQADRILKTACDTLTSAKFYSCKAEVWEDQVVGAGHKVTVTKTAVIQVRHPNGLRFEAHSAKRNRVAVYDGTSLTVYDLDKNLYGTVSAPDTIEKTLDAVHEKYGIALPLDDLLIEDPYGSAKKGITSGAYFGKATVLGVPCQHVAFSTPAVDWQLWVADGANTVRKLVITYKNEPAAPQYTAIFSDWNLGSSLPDSTFMFTPPAGAGKIDVLPVKQDQ